jgi:hypothetical protein
LREPGKISWKNLFNSCFHSTNTKIIRSMKLFFTKPQETTRKYFNDVCWVVVRDERNHFSTLKFNWMKKFAFSFSKMWHSIVTITWSIAHFFIFILFATFTLVNELFKFANSFECHKSWISIKMRNLKIFKNNSTISLNQISF